MFLLVSAAPKPQYCILKFKIRVSSLIPKVSLAAFFRSRGKKCGSMAVKKAVRKGLGMGY